MTTQCAYLLVGRGCGQDVTHQHRNQLGYSIHARSIGAVRGRPVDGLTLLPGLVQPLAGYRIYDIEHAELVRARRLLEVRV